MSATARERDPMSLTAWRAAQRHVDTRRAAGSPLSAGAIAVLNALAWCHNQPTGRCDPGRDHLAARTGLSESSVRRGIRELQDARIIRVQIRPGTGKGNRTNAYIIAPPPGAAHLRPARPTDLVFDVIEGGRADG